MTAYHLDFDATHAHIGATDDLRQRLANIARRSEIMAALYADRGLSPATGCAAAIRAVVSGPDHVDVERCSCGYPMPCAVTVPIGFCRA
jgi:hypothetical protein